MDYLPVMTRYNQWANGLIYDLAAAMPDAELRRDRKAFFGSIHGTLNHLLLVDYLWTNRMQGKPNGYDSLRDIVHDDLADLRAAQETQDAWFIDYVDGLSATDQLEAPFVYTNMVGPGENEVRVGHALLTLLNHQTHHRGQITAMLTQAGVKAPDIDVIYYMYKAGVAGPEGTTVSTVPAA